MKFIDEVPIMVKGGNGGNGCCSFEKRKFLTHLGRPDGGDGGSGGDVILRTDKSLGTLLAFKYKPISKAPKGKHGRGSNRHGKNSSPLVLKVPVGTLVSLFDTGEIIAELTKEGQSCVVARGGAKGRGNARFLSFHERHPHHFELGQPGEEKKLRLELKLLADVGIIGYPNVGKSTLLSRISAARPKIADYPFTTLTPHLGVVDAGEDRRFVVTDIPGLIPGASQGMGLGTRFLRHVEKTRVFLHMVAPEPEKSRSPRKDFSVICSEIEQYSQALTKRHQVVALNKIDIMEAKDIEKLKNFFVGQGYQFFPISAVSGKGLSELIAGLWHLIEETKDTTM